MNKGKFLLAEDGETLVGCVYVEPRGEHWYLGLLSVDPLHQRCWSGLGPDDGGRRSCAIRPVRWLWISEL